VNHAGRGDQERAAEPAICLAHSRLLRERRQTRSDCPRRSEKGAAQHRRILQEIAEHRQHQAGGPPPVQLAEQPEQDLSSASPGTRKRQTEALAPH